MNRKRPMQCTPAKRKRQKSVKAFAGKTAALLLMLAMLLSLLPAGLIKTAKAEGQGGAVTEIGSYSELARFAQQVRNGRTFAGETVRLTANLDLGGSEHPWTPIGDSKNPFKGTFDGAGHTLGGMYVTGGNAGLFAQISSAEIKNLTVSGTVSGSGSYIGGIAGNITSSTVKNCASLVDITGSNYIGGIGGYIGGSSVISGCFNEGSINGAACVGGIAGYVSTASEISSSYNRGAVSGSASSSSGVGGIAGGHKSQQPTVKNCFNAGSVSAQGSANNGGALLGACKAGKTENCYFLTGSGPDNGKGTAVTSITAQMLGDAFVQGEDGRLALAWEAQRDNSAPLTPDYFEKSELSKQLAQYITDAVESRRSRAGLSAGESLLASKDFLSGASSTGTDWMALAMGRFAPDGADSNIPVIRDGGYQAYLDAMAAYTSSTYEKNGGLLHRVKATEWHRAAVTVAALGGDPSAIGEYRGSSINLIADGSYNCKISGGPGKQGLNGWVWGLIAVNVLSSDIPDDAQYPAEDFIKEILSRQLYENGVLAGWSLGGSTDPDMTAMAIQALAPYYFDDTEYTYEGKNGTVTRSVRTCVEAALDKLGAMMDEQGRFASWGTVNSESVAQVIVALTELGIDPAKDSRFISGKGKTLLDGLLSFRDTDGGFMHTASSGWNSMANDQAAYALAAYWRFENGMRTLYDMRTAPSEETLNAISAAQEAIASIAAPSDKNYKSSVKAALAAFERVEKSERRYVRSYGRLAAALELIGGRGNLDNDSPYQIKLFVKKAPNKTVYTEGQMLDTTGLVVYARLSSGEEYEVNDYELSESGELKLGMSRIYIIRGALKTWFDITVNERIPWGGSGSAQDPYTVSDAEGLNFLSAKVSAGNGYEGVYFALACDIDLGGAAWTPIGTQKSGFAGVFDGKGFAVNGLKSAKGGLFGYASDSAVIKNLTVSGSITTNMQFVGGVLGWSNGADVINCISMADIDSMGYSGGVVGTVRAGSSVISGCAFIGSLNSPYGTALGGILGHGSANIELTIENCYTNVSGLRAGARTGITGQSSVGGIAGRIQDGSRIVSCYAAGSFTASSDAAPIIGMITSGSSAKNCYYCSDGYKSGIARGDGETVGMTAAEMKSVLAAKLGDAFKEDEYGLANGGYPLLSYQQNPSAERINAVNGRIEALSPVTAQSGQAIKEAREAYNALSEKEKPFAALSALEEAEKEYKRITGLEARRAEIIKELESLKKESDYFAAEWAEIKALLESARTEIAQASTEEQAEEIRTKYIAALDAVRTKKQVLQAKAPEITTTLRDGMTQKGSRLTFDVWARDGEGSKIAVEVTLNGQRVSYTWDDSEKTSYTLVFTNPGKNVVKVKAVSAGGAATELTYNINYEKAAPGTETGRAVWSVEIFTLGGGYLVQPVEMPIIEGETAAQQLMRLLKMNGYNIYYGGTPKASFYCAYIADGDKTAARYNGYAKGDVPDGVSRISTDINIPAMLAERLIKEGNFFDPEDIKNCDGYLGEFVVSMGSGWMYSVNNVFPNVGFADYYVSDGDVVRVQFTLGYGADIGGSAAMGGGSAGYWDTADKGELTRLIAAAGKSGLTDRENVRRAYKKALEMVQILDASQKQTDAAAEALKKALASPDKADSVKAVINAIEDIGEVTLQKEKAIIAARRAYEALTDEQKKEVSNINALINAEKALEQLKTDSCVYGHDFGEYETVKEADCTGEGLEQAKCRRCGQTQERVIPKKEHKAKDIIPAHSCTEAVTAEKRCEICGLLLEMYQVPAKEHDYSRWEEENGGEKRVCRVCGDVQYRSLTQNEGQSGTNWIPWVCGGAAVLAAAIIIIIVLLKRKKQKSEKA